MQNFQYISKIFVWTKWHLCPKCAYNPATHCISISLFHYFFIPTTIPTVPCQSPNQLRLDQCSVAYIIFKVLCWRLPHCLTVPYPVDTCLTSHGLSFPLDYLLDWLVPTLPSCQSASLSHFPTAPALHCLFAQPPHLTVPQCLNIQQPHSHCPTALRLTAPLSHCFAAPSPHILTALYPHIQK
jgi:hypothetical protein